MRRQQYDEWIAGFSARFAGRLLGRCREAVADMRAAFPELREVRGHIHAIGWGKRGHMWLESPDGEIVDPTASQFPHPDLLLYEPWKVGDEILVGKCMNCGFEIWHKVQTLTEEPAREEFCDLRCRQEVIASLNEGMTRDRGG